MTGLVTMAVAISFALIPFSPPDGAVGAGGVRDVHGVADDAQGTFDLWNSWGAGGAGNEGPRVSGGPVRTPIYQHRAICFSGSGDETPAPVGGWCESGIPRTGELDCEANLVLPTWRAFEYPDGSTTGWERIDEGACGPVLPVLTVEDFRSLPIPAPTLNLQPDQGWVLVNIATIVMTDPAPVAMRTTLAGFGVDVEARPVLFTYDFGDGHELVTRSPGAAYPDHDTFHEYEAPGAHAITLTTQWAGRYRVDGDPTWREVTGTATTSTTSAPFEVQERTSRLVGGLCTDRPTPPDC